MGRDYKERLRFHRLVIFKRLLLRSLPILVVIAVLAVILLILPTPSRWKTKEIEVASISSAVVHNGRGTTHVAELISSDYKHYIVKSMKESEAKSAFSIGEKYTVTYSPEHDGMYIKGAYGSSGAVVELDSSIQGYENWKRSIIISVAVLLGIDLAVIACTLAFTCKENRKQIKHIKHKLKASSLPGNAT